MWLPKINISFKEKAIKTSKIGQRGIVALILEDDITLEPTEILTVKEIPEILSPENKKQIELAFMGYVNPPRKIIICVVPKPLLEAEADYTEVQNYLETVRVDYVAVPQIKDTSTTAFASWIKTLRDDKKKKIKAVLPNTTANHEGVINFTTKDIEIEDNIYTTAEYCSRIAGLIAGTPLTIASTFAPLPEVLDIEKKTTTELDTAIENGEFILYNDGEKVKVGRGVNSLTTTTDTKGQSFKKIKIIEALDLIYDDIRKESEDNYLGKYANSYDNKCLLIVAIKEYLEELETAGILMSGTSTIEINIDKQIEYLRLMRKDVDSMSEKEIKEADTGSNVFLKGEIRVLDAIEDIDLIFDI